MNIAQKIAALKAKVPANGATEEEAKAALDMANKLMEKYGISEEEIKAVKTKKIGLSEKTMNSLKQNLDFVVHNCSVRIAEFCEVKVFASKPSGFAAITYFGFEQDVAMAEFLTEMLVKSAHRGWRDFLVKNVLPKKYRNKAYNSFHLGFCKSINDRLRQLVEQRSYAATTGTDLIVVKDQVVTEEFASRFGMLRDPVKPRARTVLTRVFEAGQNVAENVNLNRPVERGAAAQALK